MKKGPSRSIVFVAGAFIGNNCWDEWRDLFERRGYTCLAPAWPGKDGEPEELRNRQPNATIAANRLDTIVQFFEKVANALQEEPILIGHSLGGLVVQLLLQRGIGAAGIALHPFPPPGSIRSRFFFFKAIWPALGLLSSVRNAYMISYSKWKGTLANGLSCEQQKGLFYKYAIPESKGIIRDLLKSGAKIDFKKYHPPLLITSGDRDRMVPASIVFENYKNYGVSNSITDYKDFRGINHLPFENKSFEEEADFVLYWLKGIT